MPERIEIQRPGNDGSRTWNPVIGEEVLHLLRSKGFEKPEGGPSEAGEQLLQDTIGIMQCCCNPQADSYSETGIVIGYVQSGKTLSFTLLTAMARDNDFQIVIVIAGISVNLTKQSTARLSKDLCLDTRHDRKWVLMSNPGPDDRDMIETSLRQWSDPSFPKDRCKTILITVMKNGSHLRKLAQLFNYMQLEHVPILIIDDEGDQASLNTRASHAASEGVRIEDVISEGEVSTIYRRLTDLRLLFPLHTFLQYTATPQANLFINIMDRLSPNFIKLLHPGKEYTGGLQFFEDGSKIVVPIPFTDLQVATGSFGEPPETLLKALRLFYLGVTAGEILKDQHNRTMLIHPSRLQEGQNTYFNWVNNITASWLRILGGREEEDKERLLEDFYIDYEDLKQTAGDRFPSFEELTEANLIHAIRYTQIKLVNASRGKTPHIPWRDFYSWILIGGQSMDRGFTVEGLTVTYMPRDLGLANVDTILQRARFFGYKRSYIGYCRVLIPQTTLDAFKAIIEHEEDVRKRLLPFDKESKNLNDWDREVVLNQMLNLTRSNVLYDSVDHDRLGDEWIRIKAPHDTESLIAANWYAIDDFINSHKEQFEDNHGHPKRTEVQSQMVVAIPLQECLKDLLNKLKFTRDSDSATYSSLRGLLQEYLKKDPHEKCFIYLMSATDVDKWHTRERSLDNNDQILNLFQGRNPKSGPVVYPGDANIKEDNKVCIQLHKLDIYEKNSKHQLYANVPTLALWVPARIGKDIVRQTTNTK